MNSTNFYRAFTKRRWVLALGLALGLAVASLTQPSDTDKIQARKTRVYYKATNTLLLNAERSVPPVDYGRVTLYATKGEVPRNVERALGATRAPEVDQNSPNPRARAEASSAEIRRSAAASRTAQSVSSVLIYENVFAYITISPNRTDGSLTIEVSYGSKDGASKIANVYADELASFLQARSDSDYQEQVEGLERDKAEAETRLSELQQEQLAAELTQSPNLSVVATRVAAEQRRLGTLNATLSAVTLAGPNRLTVVELEPASPERVNLAVLEEGSEPPSGMLRLAMGASIGFLLALAIVALLEVIAARVRDVKAIESAAKLPVIAEIPAVDFDRRHPFPVAVADEPASVSAEAYRTLRTALLAIWRRHPVHSRSVSPNGNGQVASESVPPIQALLVTSPGPAEGKSVSVANLAAALSETGLSVIAIDADFRRPTLHKYLGASSHPDLASCGRNPDVASVQAVLQQTRIPGVQLLATSESTSAPGESVAVVKAVVEVARTLADVVIVDSPPLLLANDSVELATVVDATLLLARSGWTRRGAITAASDLLRRVGAVVVGIGLVGAEKGARYGYYGGYAGYGYGPGSYYAYGAYSGRHQSPAVLVKVMPWRNAKREERATEIDLRNDRLDALSGSEGDPMPSGGARNAPPPPSDSDFVV